MKRICLAFENNTLLVILSKKKYCLRMKGFAYLQDRDCVLQLYMG